MRTCAQYARDSANTPQTVDARLAGWSLSGVLVLLTIPVTVYQVRACAALLSDSKCALRSARIASTGLCSTRHPQSACPLLASELRPPLLQIALHVNHYNAPALQRHVVRIICMVPIYALVSWLSLRFSSARRWLSPLRECYEAVVLYSFISYLVGCLQRKSGDYGEWLAALPPQEPTWPMNNRLGRAVGLKTYDDGAEFMQAMRRVRLRRIIVLLRLCCGAHLAETGRCVVDVRGMQQLLHALRASS